MPNQGKATQNFVPIKEVRDGVLVLEDGSMRSILMSSSINIALKSEDEQESVIFQFQNLLNSLDFSVQFSIQSRKLDIKPYLNNLEEKKKGQTDDLLLIQIREYIEFIRAFTENINVMTKNFYVVIPYNPPNIDVEKIGIPIFGKKQEKKTKIETFEENRMQLDQRVAIVEQGLSRCGVRSVQLGTEEVVEIFYKIFNPGDIEKSFDMDLSKLQ